MNREIRFRGKRVDTGEWVYGAFVPDALEGLNDLVSWGFIRNYNREIGKMQTLEVERDTVGQYTGLHDKNGKEVYEGDIMVATYGKWHEEPKGLTRICKVIYDNKTCSFRMSVSNSKVLVSFGDSRSKDIETIGNIHDNPDLLAASKPSE